MSSNLFVLILAGGSGERFWPLSRKARPKQLLSLFDRETMLEATLRRLDGLVAPENVLILTNTDQEAAVRALVPHLPETNIVAEPAKRDTAAAIALGAGWVAARSADATMIVLPADHVIKDIPGFQRTLRVAAAAAQESGELVTIGITPTWACPGFGYIEQGVPFAGQAAASAEGPGVFEVVRFREKPSAELAQSFLAQGNFRWNAGMFVWTVPAILNALRANAPELADFATLMAGTPAAEFSAQLGRVFPTLPKISIDYAVLEKARRVLMVESGFDWDDVGSWTAIARYLADAGEGNVTNASFKSINASGNIVYSDQKSVVALMGVSDLIVVQTGDAVLICHKNDAEKIKNLVSLMPETLQ